jgi:hypothetical protein
MSFSAPISRFEVNQKSVKKDLGNFFHKENIELVAIEVPDSLYNSLLLDNGQMYNVKDGQDLLGYVYIGRVFSCRAGGCYEEGLDTVATPDDDFEYFDYYIVLGYDLAVVKVKVFNYQATHGQAICSTGWLKQFIGYDGYEKMTYGKDIDAISGATISANAITYGVQETVQYMILLKPILFPEAQRVDAGAIK